MGAIDPLSASRTSNRVAPAAAVAETEDRERAPSRAVIALTPQRSLPTRYRPGALNSATFLAQLIATKQRMPQTRERRRTDPGDASAAYDATDQASPGAITGGVVTRVV